MNEIETTTHETETFEILAYNVDLAKKGLDKLTRRAKKLGVEGLSYEVGETVVKEVWSGREDHLGRSIMVQVEFVQLHVTGLAPKLAGWVFAATVEHNEVGNLIRKVPGVEIEAPLAYRTAPRVCDHCHTNRQRKDTYLVFHAENGEWKQVGKNCLENFLGVDVSAFLAKLSFRETLAGLGEIDGDYFGGGHCEPLYGIVDFLTMVALSIRLHGWTSRSAAKNDVTERVCATADHVLWLLSPSFTASESRAKQEDTSKLIDADKELAEKALNWADVEFVGKDPLKRTEFEHNMVVALSAHEGLVAHRHTGIVASLIACYSRAISRELERKAEEAGLLNEHFGELEAEKEITRGPNKGQVKKYTPRYELTLSVVKIIDVENDWGCTHIHKMRDADGRTFCWFGSNLLRDAENGHKVVREGDSFTCAWSVKKHSEYKGRKETVLTRPGNVKVLEAVA